MKSARKRSRPGRPSMRPAVASTSPVTVRTTASRSVRVVTFRAPPQFLHALPGWVGVEGDELHQLARGRGRRPTASGAGRRAPNSPFLRAAAGRAWRVRLRRTQCHAAPGGIRLAPQRGSRCPAKSCTSRRLAPASRATVIAVWRSECGDRAAQCSISAARARPGARLAGPSSNLRC
jgi:hypothetical protein